MTGFVLVPHRDFPSAAIRTIEVDASRGAGGRLVLDYRAIGDIEQVAWPHWKGVEPADGLWEHSCFEAFVRAEGATGYAELNFTTSGQWAAYTFSGYRKGMRPIDDVLIGGGRTFRDDMIDIRRTIELPDWADAATWQVGFSAVIETLDGEKSFWALAHPDGAPDFHHDICFAATLEAPTRA
ncbi:MAG: DOMON-like domain-containing protein [Sphingomonas sp.]